MAPRNPAPAPRSSAPAHRTSAPGTSRTSRTPAPAHPEQGFSLPELLVATALLLILIGAAASLLLQSAQTHRTVWNRTQMHSAVRGATELLTQEVGQAGLVALPGAVTLAAAANVGNQTVSVSSAAGMFVGEQLVIDTGDGQETVTLTAVGANTMTATFAMAHANGAGVRAIGGFPTGIVPPTMANGSSGTVLKLYGDVNNDGSMVYVEYTCDTANQRLYRNVMPWNAGAKPPLSTALVLLDNIVTNPNGTPCFTYQTAVVGADTYVLDVAITLTVQTQDRDPVTGQFQLESKTLLNVSPRNVFNVWELASIHLLDRLQPMPPSVAVLLP